MMGLHNLPPFKGRRWRHEELRLGDSQNCGGDLEGLLGIAPFSGAHHGDSSPRPSSSFGEISLRHLHGAEPLVDEPARCFIVAHIALYQDCCLTAEGLSDVC